MGTSNRTPRQTLAIVIFGLCVAGAIVFTDLWLVLIKLTIAGIAFYFIVNILLG